jgi:hypothetical protein
MITAITVNYNTPELLERLLSSFRKFYNIPFLVIDGSNNANFNLIKSFDKIYDVEIYHVNYNIHHGPGIAYAFENLQSEQILILDSDVMVLNNGFIEDLQNDLDEKSYGIGDVQIVDKKGRNVKKGIEYLHPACCLINRKVALNYSLPIKHGAPMINAMNELHEKNESHLLQHKPWVANDFRNKDKIFISHEWKGTVRSTKGYHL